MIKNAVQIFMFLGSSGGIFYWYDRIRNRARIKIRFLNEKKFYSSQSQITFEVENLSMEKNSIEPHIIFKAFTDVRGKRITCIFKIDSENRLLKPYEPKNFDAATKHNPDSLLFSAFRTYIFTPTKGRAKYVRMRHAVDNNLSFVKYYCGLCLFLLKCKIATLIYSKKT